MDRKFRREDRINKGYSGESNMSNRVTERGEKENGTEGIF